MTAKSRYDELSSSRSQFLNSARQAAELTLPYLIREDETHVKVLSNSQHPGNQLEQKVW